MKVFSIVGARPQFIKLAPLSSKLSSFHEEIIIHTGQHYDYEMSEKIFNDLNIRKPDIHLGTGSGSHAHQTAEMMKSLEVVMTANRPDLIIVFGDTNSTVAAALVAAKLRIKILHIEAGLRSFNKNMPEEINRIVTDHVSHHLFAPTLTATRNLENEGLGAISSLTGDIMVDTLKTNLEIAKQKTQVPTKLGIDANAFNLLTLHRDYNVDNTSVLENILTQLGHLDEKIVFPVHPRTKKMISASYSLPRNFIMCEPLGYLDFIALEHLSKRIITDSGGIQKEAYLLKKPCITLRSETEWMETVEEKWNLLINPSDNTIVERIVGFNVPDFQKNVFGENVTDKMITIINSL